MKKIFSLLLVFVLIFLLAACSTANKTNKTNSTENSTNVSDDTVGTESAKRETASVYGEETSNSNKTNEDYEPSDSYFKSIYSFSDGLARVANDNFFGYVDEKGYLKFRYNKNDVSSFTDFENGYAYLHLNNKALAVINKAGDIVHTYPKFVSYGYGYVIVEKHESGFDSSVYKYEIYDPDGNIVDTINSETPSDTLSVSYCGDGVFSFSNNCFFFAKTKKWVKDHADCYSFNSEGKAFSRDENTLADSSGDFQKGPDEIANKIRGGMRLNDLLYGDTVYIYYDEGRLNTDKSFLSYNVSNNSISSLNDSTILERLCTQHGMGTWDQVLVDPSFNKNGIIVYLVGDDYKDYIALLDNQLNIIINPVEKRGNYKALENGNFFINGSVYDKNGQIVYKADFMNSSIQNNDSIVSDIVADSENITIFKITTIGGFTDSYYFAVDKTGKVIFDHIDTANTITKTIQE